MSFLDQLAKLKEEIATGDFEKVAYLKLPVGKPLRLRLLPGVDEEPFAAVSRLHYNISPENPKMYVTCQKSKDPRAACPVCVTCAELESSANSVDKEQAKKIRSQQKFYLNVLPREGDQAGKVVVWTVPKTVLNSIIELIENPEYGEIFDIINGFDIYIKRTGEGRETKYTVTASRNPSPLDEDGDVIEALLGSRIKLSRFADPPDVDEVVAMLAGEIKFFTTGGFGRAKDEPTTPTTHTKDTSETDEAPVDTEAEAEPAAAPTEKAKTGLSDLKARFKK